MSKKNAVIQSFITAATILIHLLPIASPSRHPDGFTYKECLPDKETCEYWLNIQEKLTMIFHKDLVYADKGRLYLYNEHPSNYTTEVLNINPGIPDIQLKKCRNRPGARRTDLRT